MEQLAKPYHTGSVEVFHSLLLAYAPKRQEFDLNTMNARVQLAILDHNNNVGREQDRCNQGSKKEFRKSWSEKMGVYM